MDEIILKTNYRSESILVEFVNSIFIRQSLEPNLKSLVKELFDEENFDLKEIKPILNTFKNVQQNTLSTERKGYICAQIVLKKEQALKLSIMQKVLEQLKDLFMRGFKGENIAILVRANSEVEYITSFFSHSYYFSVTVYLC